MKLTRMLLITVRQRRIETTATTAMTTTMAMATAVAMAMSTATAKAMVTTTTNVFFLLRLRRANPKRHYEQHLNNNYKRLP